MSTTNPTAEAVDPFGDLFSDEATSVELPPIATETVETTEAVAVAPVKKPRAPRKPKPEAAAPAPTPAPVTPMVSKDSRDTGGEVSRVSVFDIETGPESEERLREVFTFDPMKVKDYELINQEFAPNSIKVGNMKDPAKIAAKIQGERDKFDAAKAAAIRAMESAESDQWAAFVERAALSPLTGRVLAIGYRWTRDGNPEGNVDSVGTDEYCDAKGNPIVVDPRVDESTILVDFWSTFAKAERMNWLLVGHNIFGFDLPFLIRRSWLLGVDVPANVLPDGRHGHRLFIDTMTHWGCGNRELISLDSLAAYFGAPRKNGDGAQFAKLYYGTPEEQQQAIAYLENDLTMTWEVAAKMGIGQ